MADRMDDLPGVRWWPLAIGAVVIFAASGTPIDRDRLQQRAARLLPEPLRPAFADAWNRMWFYIVKGSHFTAYAVLTRFAYVALRDGSSRGYDRKALAGGSALCLLNAVSDEFHQTRVPGRQGTLMDVMIDAAGICTGALSIIYRRPGESRRQADVKP